MILKGSQRGGARQLATHLLNDRDNDHVTVGELRGFVAEGLYGAMAETQAIARGTRCKQSVFSLSLNPPKDVVASRDDLFAAADRAEQMLGLEDQPRAVVIHEKNGRLHAHVVWSRIDPETMKAVNLPFFKNKLNELSRELYLQHGWELPEGYKTNGWKNPLNFTLAEWQQAKRLGLDPRELKQAFQSAWQQSDNLASFRSALEDKGFYLAQGDRRGVVALDLNGEVFSVARMAGIKTKEMAQRLRGFESLPGVAQVRADIEKHVAKGWQKACVEQQSVHDKELKPLMDERKRMVEGQRWERARLEKGQAERLARENKERAAKLRSGLGKVLDVLTGKLFKVRRENEREAFQGYLRDRAQREALFTGQLKDRQGMQLRLDEVQARHRQERMRLARRFLDVMRPSASKDRDHQRSPSFERTLGRSQLNKR